jgi:hypothetical protein
MYGASGITMLIGSAGNKILTDSDSYYSFKKQLDKFVEYLRTGVEPFPFSETIELMKLLIGGIMSREQGGRKVLLSEIKETVS